VHPQLDGGCTRPNGDPPSNPVHSNTGSMESLCRPDTFRSAQFANETEGQPALLQNGDGYNSKVNITGRWQSSCDDNAKPNLMDQFQKNSLDHRSECDRNGPTPSSTPKSNSRAVQFEENSSHFGVNLKLLSSKDCRQSGTTNCCSEPPENVELQTQQKQSCESRRSRQKLVVDYDKGLVNGFSSSAAVIENMPVETSIDDDDGVVFNTRDVEVVFAVKLEKEPPNGLVEFCEPTNGTDPLIQWDVESLDLPHKIYRKCDDRNMENTALLEYVEYADGSRRISKEPSNGLQFSPEGKQTYPRVVNGRSILSQSSSSNSPARVFSDISDDEITDEPMRDCSGETARSQPFLGQDEIRLTGQNSSVVRVDYEAEYIHNNGDVEADTASRLRNNAEYVDCERIDPDNIRNSSISPTYAHISQAGAGKEISSNTTEDSQDVFAIVSDSAPHLQTSIGHSLTELSARESTASFKIQDFGRMRGRRRNGFSSKTISALVDMLLKTRDASECNRQQRQLENSDCENMDQLDEVVCFSAPSPDLPELCADKPGSPMDEAPPLLPITDLLSEGSINGQLTRVNSRSAFSGVGYDSDDAEAAMPIIEDMRSLMPNRRATDDEVRENHYEGTKSPAKPRRKTSKPLKRKIPAARKDLMEIERTLSLPVACDRCTFTCGLEQVLHRHLKLSHQVNAGSSAKARYVCAGCSTTAADKESYFEHVAHHPGQHIVRYYVCSQCGSDTNDMETMDRHVANSHSGEVLRFEVVQERVTYLDNLLDCPICGVAFRWKDNFVDHVRNYHHMEQLAVYLERGYRNHPCPEKISIHRDDVTGQSSGSTSQNSQNNSSDVVPYRNLSEISSSFNFSLSVVVHICCRCTFSTDDIDAYFEHYRSHFSPSGPTHRTAAAVSGADREPQSGRAQEERGGNVGGLYSCHLCPFKTPKRRFYHRHMAIHERNTGMTDGYRCGYCQFAHPRLNCIKFHLGKYHGNRRTKLIRISDGVESEIFEDGQDFIDENETASNSATNQSPCSRFGNQQVSSCDSLLRSSFSSSTTTASESEPPVREKTKVFANDRIKRLFDFERRLPPSMVYPDPVKCPVCDFTNNVRINLIRHIRTHKDDDQEEMENAGVDYESGLTAAESRLTGTPDDDEPTENTSSQNSVTDTSFRSTSTKPRLTQQILEYCLVNIFYSTLYLMP